MSPDQNDAPADDTLCMCEVCEIHRREDAEHAAVHARAEAALASAERMANGLLPFQVGDIVRETRNDAWGDVDAPVVRVCHSGVVVMAHPVRGEGGFEPHTLRLVTPAPYRQWRAPPEVVDFYAGEQWDAKVLDTLERKREAWGDVVWGRPLDIPWRPGKMGSPAFKEAQQAWNKASSDTVAAMTSEPAPAKALDSLDGLTSAQRKNVPIATGVIDYFPDAIAAVAAVSKAGSEQHHPGEPLHWDRSKSADEADCLMRHFVDRGKFDTCGHRHSAKVAWRALAMLQKEIEYDRAEDRGVYGSAE